MSASAKMARIGLLVGAILPGPLGSYPAAADVAPPAAPADRAPASVGAADDNSNPYAVIVDRNVFRLNPPPPPVSANSGPPPDLPEVKLSGFIQTENDWKVLLAVTMKSGNSQTPEASFLTMSEGEKQGVVELLKVYPSEEKVEIVDSGTKMTLSMKDNGFKSKPGAAAAAGQRGGAPAVRPAGIQPSPPGVTPQPGLPGMGAAPQFGGQNPDGSQGTMVGGGRFNSAAFGGGAPNPGFGGGAANPGFQPQPTSFEQGFNARTGSGIISGGGAYGAPAAPTPLAIPLGDNNLSHLTQPNSTPIAPNPSPNVQLPPMPGGDR